MTDTTYIKLLNNLEQLNLIKTKENIDTYLDAINSGTKTIIEALYELTDKELIYKNDMAEKAMVKVANFPYLKEISDFDFSFNQNIDKAKIMDLISLRFIEKAENIIFCGSPGTGKTHLAVSIGIEAARHRYPVYFISFEDLIAQLRKAKYENRLEKRVKWFCRYKILIIDELGYQKMDVESANLFFNLIAKKYEKTSIIITTNTPFSRWSEIFNELTLTNALLDRLIHHSHIFNITGNSYRMKDLLEVDDSYE